MEEWFKPYLVFILEKNPKLKFLAEVSQPNPGFFNPSHLLLLTTLFNSLNIFYSNNLPQKKFITYIHVHLTLLAMVE